ncbi:MAG: hypothetical protein NTZ25_04265 [Candidatus Peregrinibacteria bacterium]|nr:hypothetical protein [Candidatus Peregrinibacteria bacterium]
MAGLDNGLAAEVDENDVIGPLGISMNHLAKFMSLPDCEHIEIKVGEESGLLTKRTEDPKMVTFNFTVIRESDRLPARYLVFFYCENPLMFRVLNGTIEETRDFLDKIGLSSFKE